MVMKKRTISLYDEWSRIDAIKVPVSSVTAFFSIEPLLV